MSSFQFANSIIEWERRIEEEETRRKYNRIDPYVNYLAPVEPTHKERSNFFTRLFRRKPVQKPEYSTQKEKSCKDPQPC
jgi:hypothetical protein